MIFMVTFMWTAEAGVLIANDEFGKEIVRVNTGGTHWDFQFTDIGGNGRIRVGAGCNYNPLSLIQEMVFLPRMYSIEVLQQENRVV